MQAAEVGFVVATVGGAILLLGSGQPFWLGLAASAACFAALWLASLALRDASIVDIFWGPGFIVLGWLYLVLVPAGAPTARGLLVAVLVTIWAVRLAVHIGVRNAGKGEDFRYRAWRERAGRSFWWVSLFKVFLLQAIVLWVVSSPLLLAQLDGPDQGLSWLDWTGLALWLVGFVFEAVADWQLTRFKRDAANRGRVLDSGLWSLSRHPNYFGEALLWWGVGLVSLTPGGPLALLGPALLTFSLLKISGVSMLEDALVERRPGYAEYIATTPSFVPLPRVLRRRRGSEA